MSVFRLSSRAAFCLLLAAVLAQDFISTCVDAELGEGYARSVDHGDSRGPQQYYHADSKDGPYEQHAANDYSGGNIADICLQVVSVTRPSGPEAISM